MVRREAGVPDVLHQSGVLRVGYGTRKRSLTGSGIGAAPGCSFVPVVNVYFIARWSLCQLRFVPLHCESLYRLHLEVNVREREINTYFLYRKSYVLKNRFLLILTLETTSSGYNVYFYRLLSYWSSGLPSCYPQWGGSTILMILSNAIVWVFKTTLFLQAMIR